MVAAAPPYQQVRAIRRVPCKTTIKQHVGRRESGDASRDATSGLLGVRKRGNGKWITPVHILIVCIR